MQPYQRDWVQRQGLEKLRLANERAIARFDQQFLSGVITLKVYRELMERFMMESLRLEELIVRNAALKAGMEPSSDISSNTTMCDYE